MEQLVPSPKVSLGHIYGGKHVENNVLRVNRSHKTSPIQLRFGYREVWESSRFLDAVDN